MKQPAGIVYCTSQAGLNRNNPPQAVICKRWAEAARYDLWIKDYPPHTHRSTKSQDYYAFVLSCCCCQSRTAAKLGDNDTITTHLPCLLHSGCWSQRAYGSCLKMQDIKGCVDKSQKYRESEGNKLCFSGFNSTMTEVICFHP